MQHRFANVALRFPDPDSPDREPAMPVPGRSEPEGGMRPLGLPAPRLSDDMHCVARTMLCYRYRTAALVGPWRARAIEAIDDAVLARQAEPDQEFREGFRWLVKGIVEEGFGRHPTPPAEIISSQLASFDA